MSDIMMEKHAFSESVMREGRCRICGNGEYHSNHQADSVDIALGARLLLEDFDRRHPGVTETQSATRCCRECGIDHIEPGTEIDGQPLAWADDDLCSHCQEGLQGELIKDAARYRFLRNRPTGSAAIAAGGVFGGQIPDNLILGGEHLDRAVDAAMGHPLADQPPLEDRLAECLALAIDTPLMTVRDEGHSLDLFLGSFKPEIAEQAAGLLEEAGK